MNNRFTFLHIPKTGGTSFTCALQSAVGDRSQQMFEASTAEYDKDVFFGHIQKGGHAWNSTRAFYTAILLRHPFDRVVSVYMHYRRSFSELGGAFEQGRVCGENSLQSVLENRDARIFCGMDNATARMLVPDYKGPDDRRRVIASLEEFTVVGITNAYSRFVRKVAYKLGRIPLSDAGRLNVGQQFPDEYWKLYKSIMDINEIDYALWQEATKLI